MNIFICYTPLHALIAERIINTEKLTEIIVIYFYDNDSPKNRLYFNRIARNAEMKFYRKKCNNVLTDLIKILHISFNIVRNKGKKHNFYLASLKTVYSRLFLPLIGYRRIYSFDDGVGNIAGGGYFYDKNERGFSKLFFSLFYPRLLYKNIEEIVQKHFTIFSYENVYRNTKKIELLPVKVREADELPVKTILLTSPFSEDGLLTEEKEKEIYHYLIEKYKIDSYIAHPREGKIKITDKEVERIDTELIAEEYILELAEKYKVRVIGIYTTSLILLKNINNISVLNIHIELPVGVIDVKKKKNLFDTLGIETCNVD